MGKTPYMLRHAFRLIFRIMIEEIMTQAVEPAGAALQCRTSRPRRILVVEDDRDLRQINAMVLHHAGYHVDTAVDGASGWKALKASPYDVLITDNTMPRVTGLELIMKVRSEEMPLSVILASGTAPTEELNRHPWLQLDAVLLKPYTAKAILDSVKKVLRKADGAADRFPMFGSLDLKHNKIPQAGQPASAPVQCQTSPPRRILVVDDEPDIRRLHAEVLKNSGYHVDTAEDGIAGWEALHAVRHAPESYALLITDHDMPGLSGLELVKKVRAARMALPVVLATGKLPKEDLFTRYPWIQPAAALVKPYSTEQFLGTVEAALCMAQEARAEISPPPNPPSTGVLQL
jgi:DNA-binding response OmpR family regulator